MIQKKIMEIYDDPKLYQDMKFHAKKSFEQYFSAPEMHGAYLKYYEKIVEGLI